MAMELRQLGDNTWYIPGRVNVGYYEENGYGYLIDTGIDDDQGRKLLNLLKDRGVPLRAVINTHSNADHIGANSFIQKRTDCEVWTTLIEAALTESPTFEPMFLWGGFPFPQIRGKFIEAKPSRTSPIPNNGLIRDTKLTAYPLPGHYLDMIGVRTPDDVIFLADALFDPEILKKYRFMVMLDIRRAYETLDWIADHRASWYVPCHAGATQDIETLVMQNKEALTWLSEAVYDTLSKPVTREDILSEISMKYSLDMDVSHLLLNLSSVSAHLSFLAENGRIEPFVENSRMFWRRTTG